MTIQRTVIDQEDVITNFNGVSRQCYNSFDIVEAAVFAKSSSMPRALSLL